MFNFMRHFIRNKEFIREFEKSLGENLVSLIQYGSSIKGGANSKSDINLLIVLRLSTPEAHSVIHQIVNSHPTIEPFVLGELGIEKTFQHFAVKFLSIKRHHKLLSGIDILNELNITTKTERFLAEQALRNLRLKIVHGYIKEGASLNYLKYIITIKNSLFINISEVARCEDIALPETYDKRIPVLKEQFQFDVSILNYLFELKNNYKNIDKKGVETFHRELFSLMDNIIHYIERNWNE
jgi:hypothetical protein